MMKRIARKFAVFCIILSIAGVSAHAVELGLTAGHMSKTYDSGTHYGIVGGTGMIVPLVKLEFEMYRKSGEYPVGEFSNGMSLGIKLRPQWGKLAPYGIIGFGTEYETVGLDFDEYNSFTFFGGGVHFFFSGMVSLRGDVRFYSFSDSTRTRLSAGVFIHF